MSDLKSFVTSALRNREAVRKYRARKKATLQSMEDELSNLRTDNNNLRHLLRNVQVC